MQRTMCRFLLGMVSLFLSPGVGPADAHSDGNLEPTTVFGLWVESPLLLEMLDLHGHDVDPELMPCAACREAYATDGYCVSSGLGFVDRRAYVSELGYGLARSAPANSTGCAACADAGDGWCDACQRGRLADREFTQQSVFALTRASRDQLRAALKLDAHCRLCAVALFDNTRCPVCNITYAEGRALRVPGSSP